MYKRGNDKFVYYIIIKKIGEQKKYKKSKEEKEG